MADKTNPTLTVAKTLPKDADVVIVGVRGNPPVVDVPAELGKAFAKQFGAAISDLALRVGAKSKVAATAVLPGLRSGSILPVGLGDREPTPQTLRGAAGAAVRRARDLGERQHVVVALPAGEPELVRAVAEGALLGDYAYVPITSGTESPPKIERITVVSAARPNPDLVREVTIVAAAVNQARDWVNVPPNLLYPDSFAQAAKAAVADSSVAVDILDEEALAAGGYGGLLAVGGGSSRPPRLTRLAYAPRGANAHLVLVGKGITFDSGGLDIKPPESMYTMKCDMGGAAAVLAATKAIADLGLKIKVTAYATMAENLPSDTAYRPSDVLTMYGGTTVENGNTDAEGRLVMADGLARSNEDDPDLVVDVATLTGACMIALGTKTFGVFSDFEEVAERVLAAAESAGEDAWPLPIPEWTAEALESKVADIKSTGERYGGASFAAAFLRRFVDAATPWAHLDIAGAAFNESAPSGYIPAGGTGVAVRTLVELARSMQD